MGWSWPKKPGKARRRWACWRWGGIPLRRGEADLEAIHLALAALKQGKIVVIAPEGTRSGHERLQPLITQLAPLTGPD